MSFGQFKGKLVWGSSVFRILLETESKRLGSNFSGNLFLYERRHEQSKVAFSNHNQFLTGVKEMWQSSLSVASVQDSRIARWIEEYFTELGIQVSYQVILDALRGQFEEVKPIEVSSEKVIQDVELTSFIQDKAEVQSRGLQRTIEGDLDDQEEMERILENYLLENKQVRKDKVKSTGSFKLADGTERSFDENKTIIDTPLSTELTLESGFNNTFGFAIMDISISDVIPYDFEIADIKVSGEHANQSGQNKTEDGLEVTWTIPKLEPGQNTSVEYILDKRMLRTILIRDDNDVTLLHTYEDIKKQDNDIWVESTYIFHDKTPIVENVKILDQLPSDLKLKASRPDAVPPSGKISPGIKETEVTWSYSNVPAQTQFVVEYDLIENPRIFRDVISLLDQNDETVAEIVKIVKPLSNTNGYGVIFAVKSLQEIPRDITIQDVLSSTIEVNEVHLDAGEIAQ
ncbi:MAG: hypothetical protein ACXAD7_24075, partial [Candidatus Kariarchaeaceae archaeon]